MYARRDPAERIVMPAHFAMRKGTKTQEKVREPERADKGNRKKKLKEMKRSSRNEGTRNKVVAAR